MARDVVAAVIDAETGLEHLTVGLCGLPTKVAPVNDANVGWAMLEDQEGRLRSDFCQVVRQDEVALWNRKA